VSTYEARDDLTRPVAYQRNAKGKITKAYSFKTTEQRDTWIEQMKALDQRAIDKRAERKAEKAELRAQMTNPYQVGDIFTESWGYDQTNVDAYQVVAVTARTVSLREIAVESVQNTGWASDKVVPVPDKFLVGHPKNNGVIRKTLQPYTEGIGGVSVPSCYVPSVSGHGWMTLWAGGDRAMHRSWYA
jgi:hypothetical protein